MIGLGAGWLGTEARVDIDEEVDTDSEDIELETVHVLDDTGGELPRFARGAVALGVGMKHLWEPRHLLVFVLW